MGSARSTAPAARPGWPSDGSSRSGSRRDGSAGAAAPAARPIDDRAVPPGPRARRRDGRGRARPLRRDRQCAHRASRRRRDRPRARARPAAPRRRVPPRSHRRDRGVRPRARHREHDDPDRRDRARVRRRAARPNGRRDDREHQGADPHGGRVHDHSSVAVGSSRAAGNKSELLLGTSRNMATGGSISFRSAICTRPKYGSSPRRSTCPRRSGSGRRPPDSGTDRRTRRSSGRRTKWSTGSSGDSRSCAARPRSWRPPVSRPTGFATSRAGVEAGRTGNGRRRWRRSGCARSVSTGGSEPAAHTPPPARPPTVLRDRGSAGSNFRDRAMDHATYQRLYDQLATYDDVHRLAHEEHRSEELLFVIHTHRVTRDRDAPLLRREAPAAPARQPMEARRLGARHRERVAVPSRADGTADARGARHSPQEGLAGVPASGDRARRADPHRGRGAARRRHDLLPARDGAPAGAGPQGRGAARALAHEARHRLSDREGPAR